MVKYDFKIGDIVVITKTGGGTTFDDVGLVCKVINNNAKHITYPTYIIEIDKIKEGNNDKFLSPNVIRLATPEEVIEAGYKQKIKIHELW